MSPPKLVDPEVLRDLVIPPPRDRNFFEVQKWNIAIIVVMFLGFSFSFSFVNLPKNQYSPARLP